MYCEIVNEGQRVRGPVPYREDIVRALVIQLGFTVPALPETLTEKIAIYPGFYIIPASYEKPNTPPGYLLSAPNRAARSNDVTYTFNIVPRDVEASRAALITRLGTHHERYESQRLNYYGILIMADLEARVNVSYVYDRYKAGRYRGRRITWRGSNGRIRINSLEEMEELYLAIVGYVETGFAAKEIAEQEVYGATIETLYALDPIATFDAVVAQANGQGAA